jgi:hypothetical protein
MLCVSELETSGVWITHLAFPFFQLTREVVARAVTAQSLYGWEIFYARMDKSGRITIPKLTLRLLQSRADKQDLTGAVIEVSIEPA